MAEAVHVPAHGAPPGSPQAKRLVYLHAQLSLGQSCHRQKKSCAHAHRVTWVVSHSLRPCRLWPAWLLCQGGVLQARILQYIGQNWLPYPSRAQHFLLPWLPTPLSTWCCQNPCDPSSSPTSTPGPHRGKPKPSRAASGANPSRQPISRGGNKTTTETQGQCD